MPQVWSPVDGGRAVNMEFTHDINSVGNFHTDKEWVKVGASTLNPKPMFAP